jgi:hypothetical protein
MNDDDRLRAMFAKAFETAIPTDDCPTPEALLDAFHRQVGPDAANDIVDHVAICPVCAEAWRLAKQTPAPAPSRR